MLKKASLSWNARQFSKAIAKEEAVFDSAVQRRLVWKDDKKSLLIHSMIEGYPIPAMYAANENGKKSFIDGKQRGNCIHDFLNDKFVLKDFPLVTLEDGTEVNFNGKKFSELPEDIRDIISNYSLTIYYYDEITDDEICELFYRLNNGVSPSAIERSRTKCKSLSTIQDIGKHELFITSLTKQAFEKYTHEDLVIKSYIMLTYDEPCYDNKVVRPALENAVFTKEDIKQLNSIYDRILEVYKILIADESTATGKMSKKVAKRVITRTHLLSIIPIVKRSLDENVDVDTFTSWIKNFFCGKKKPTNYEQYNSNASSGSGHLESIKGRLTAINKDYDKFMKNIAIKKMVEETMKETENEESVEETNTLTKNEEISMKNVEENIVENNEGLKETVVEAEVEEVVSKETDSEDLDYEDYLAIMNSTEKEPTDEELAALEKELEANNYSEYETSFDDLLDEVINESL